MKNFIGWKELQKHDYSCSKIEALLISLVVVAILIIGSEEFASLIINLF